MIIVQETFVCKPGNASRLARLFKEVMSGFPEVKHIVTDMTGQFNRVVVISQYESLTAYENNWNEMMQNPEEMKKMEEKMKGYHEMYSSGSREIFRVW